MAQSKETVRESPYARIVQTILSDGSDVYDVHVGLAGQPGVTLLALSDEGARAIFDAIQMYAVGVE